VKTGSPFVNSVLFTDAGASHKRCDRIKNSACRCARPWCASTTEEPLRRRSAFRRRRLTRSTALSPRAARQTNLVALAQHCVNDSEPPCFEERAPHVLGNEAKGSINDLDLDLTATRPSRSTLISLGDTHVRFHLALPATEGALNRHSTF